MATDVTCLQCGKPYDASVVANRFAGVCPACLARFASQESDVEPSPGIADPAMKPPLKLGGTFHGLEVVELLGAGGMGVVYKARQPGLDRFVALKVLSPKLTSDVEFIARFNREAKAMAALSHNGIVQVFDYGQEADLCYLVMEYVDGLSLRQLMKERRLSPDAALKVVPKICEALGYAHSKGVIHRDIKPENILLDREGRLKIADFGLARVVAPDGAGAQVTNTNVVMGTPGYMAPEQYQSMKVDHRADIYSLGAVFYEMLTGEVPIGRFDVPSSKVQIDVRLDEIVLKTLATLPERRYQHASEVKTAVEDFETNALPPLQEEATRARNDPWMPVLLKYLFPALGALAGVIVALGWISFSPWRIPDNSGGTLTVMGLIAVGIAVVGIFKWDERWGKPTPPWRWRIVFSHFVAAFLGISAYASLLLWGADHPSMRIWQGIGRTVVFAAYVIFLGAVRYIDRRSNAPMGDEHLPRLVQDAFRASTLAASALAVMGISYALLIIGTMVDECIQPGSRVRVQGAALGLLAILQIAATMMSSSAISRRQPRSGRLQAYAALVLSLPPIGPLVAVWHLFTTENQMLRPQTPSAEPVPVSGGVSHPGRQLARWLLLISLMIVIIALLVFVAFVASRGGVLGTLLGLGMVLPLLLGFRRIEIRSAEWAQGTAGAGAQTAPSGASSVRSLQDSKTPKPRIRALSVSSFILVIAGGALFAVGLLKEAFGLYLVGGMILVLGMLQALGAMLMVRKLAVKPPGAGLAFAAFMIAIVAGVAGYAYEATREPELPPANLAPTKPSRKFRAILDVTPPRSLIEPEQTIRKIQGPVAMKGRPLTPDEEEEAGSLLTRVKFGKDALPHLVALTILGLREKESGEPVTVRLAEVGSGFTPRFHSQTSSHGNWATFTRWGIIVEIQSPDRVKGQAPVDRMFKFYKGEFERIEREMGTDQ